MNLKMVDKIKNKYIIPYVRDAHNIVLFSFFFLIVSLEICQLYSAGVLSILYYLFYVLFLSIFSIRSLMDKDLYIHVGYYILLLGIEAALNIMFIAGSISDGNNAFMMHIVFVIFGNSTLIVLQCMQIKRYYSAHPKKIRCRTIKKELILLMFALIVSVLLNLECINSWVRWDSYIYYDAICELSINDIFSTIAGGESGLVICKHLSSSFGLFLLIIKSISGLSLLNSIYLGNMLLIAADIILVYCIVRKLIPNRSDTFYFLSSLICGVSPCVLGTANFINPEHFLLTSLLVFIYGNLRNCYIVCLLSVFAMCNAKETGVVIAACMVAVSFLKSFVSYYKSKKTINIGYYVCVFIIGVLWLLKYLMVNWGAYNSLADRELYLLDGSTVNAFGFSKLHILDICKGGFLSNFSWIFFIIFFFAVVKAVMSSVRGHKIFFIGGSSRLWDYWEILVGFFAYHLILCFFVTWHFFRYYILLTIFLYIIGIVLLSYLVESLKYRELISCITLLIIAVLLFVQCYYTIDPVMLTVFKTFNTGGGTIVSTDIHMTNYNDPAFNEAVCYNRQVMYFDDALDRALLYIEPDDNTIILVSDEFVASETVGSVDAVWGRGYRYGKNPRWEKFDMDKGYRYLEDFPEHKLQFGFISEEKDVIADYMKQWDRVFYLEMPWENLTDNYLKEEYKDSFILKDTIQYRGWILNVYQFINKES